MAKNLSKTVRENIPFIIHQNKVPMNKKELRDAYVVLEGCSDEHDFGTNKDTWSKLRSAIHGAAPKLVKNGILYQPSKGKFDLVQGATIPSAFVPFLNGQPAPVAKIAPVAKVAPAKVAPVDEVEPMIEVEVSNPAVIEAHIDTETQELVENVGGSRDWRKPLDSVEDGYITSSSVQVSTTTLMPVADAPVEESPSVEVEVEPVAEVEVDPVAEVEVDPVEVEVEPVAEVEVKDEVLPPLEIEMPVEDDMEVEEEEDDDQPRYDLKELRKKASFDPLTITLRGVTGSYEVYRDLEERNIVLTQKGREDYVIIPVDVSSERLKELKALDERFSNFARGAIKVFGDAGNHKEGCVPVVKALISCTSICHHTDDFGGLAEPCPKADECPLQSIWGGQAIYVES